MNHKSLFAACISLWLLIFPVGIGVAITANISDGSPTIPQQSLTQNNGPASDARPGIDTGTSKESAFFYPDPLLQKLKINSYDIINNQSRFRNDPIHIEWMDHVHSALPDICSQKEETIIKTHTSLLFVKSRLDKDYFSGKISKQEFANQLTGLMKWFQEANRSVLSIKEYNALFGISDQDEAPAQALDGELGFPIRNPNTTIDKVKEAFDDQEIISLTRFYQEQAREFHDIKNIYDTENIHGVEKEQIKKDMERIERELQTAFMNYCRDRLSDEKFKLLFGSQINE